MSRRGTNGCKARLKPALLMVTVLSCSFSQADMLEPPKDAPWEICALCHGLYGDSAMAKFPKLAGQKPAYLKQQVLAFRKGSRQNDGGQMQAIVGELKPDDIDKVVGWFSVLKAPEPARDKISPGEYARLQSLLSVDGREGLSCDGCHNNATTQIPFIKAQHADYLLKQLRDYQQDKRHTEVGAHTATSELTDFELGLLVRYYASQAR